MTSLNELFLSYKKDPLIRLETIDIKDFFSNYQKPMSLKDLVDHIKETHFFNEESRKGEYFNGTICWYSGGLESSLIASKIYSHNTHARFVNALNVEKAKMEFGHHLVEPLLILTAYLLGAREVVLGLEYGPEENNIGNNEEFGEEWIGLMSAELNMTILQPLVMTSKYELFRNAVSDNIQFISCSENPQDSIHHDLHWCGSCFKCFQIETFYRIYNIKRYRIWQESLSHRWISSTEEFIDVTKQKKSPIQISTDMPVKRYITELKDYYENGVRNMENGNSNDPFTDNWTMIDSLLLLYRTNPIETLSYLWSQELK